jgi:basic amino acid/polyamine antiporter, APA family
MTFAQLWRCKHPEEHQGELNRCLGAWDLTLLGIGAIIGTGIFVLTGIAAATQAGPAVVVAFVVSGIACAFAALAYAELAASVGGSGSAYGYSYAAFGEFIAWVIGWDLILEYGVATAAVANGWSGYFNNALSAISNVINTNIALPTFLTQNYFEKMECIDLKARLAGGTLDASLVDKANNCIPEGFMDLPAFLIIFILMFLLIAGVRESARLNAGMVFVKLLAITIFIAVAVFHINTANWTPFAPFGWFETTADGKTVGILAAASLVFFAYVGFDAVSTAVEEARDPQRTVPIGILASLIFCTVIYIVVSGLLTGIVPYPELNVSSPVAHALQLVGVSWASALVATGVIAGLTTVMLVLYYALTRILLAISRDGLIPPLFSQVSAKTKTPVKNTVICGVIMAIFAGFVPLGVLAELVNIGTLAAFVLVCGGVIVLRIKHPDAPRPFKAPGGIAIPILGVLSCGALITFLPLHTHLRFIVWLAIGLVIYFGYSLRHSKLRTV